MSASVFMQALCVSADHPSLPGHFPGQPVVPGVVILDAVRAAALQHLGSNCVLRRMPQIKFLQPLLPGQLARIEMDQPADVADGQRVRFRVLLDVDVIDPPVIATGDVVIAERAAHD